MSCTSKLLPKIEQNSCRGSRHFNKKYCRQLSNQDPHSHRMKTLRNHLPKVSSLQIVEASGLHLRKILTLLPQLNEKPTRSDQIYTLSTCVCIYIYIYCKELCANKPPPINLHLLLLLQRLKAASQFCKPPFNMLPQYCTTKLSIKRDKKRSTTHSHCHNSTKKTLQGTYGRATGASVTNTACLNSESLHAV